MKMKSNKQLDILDTVVGAGSTFEGTIKTEGSVRVEGKVLGDITCSGDLTVGASGNIEANIDARNITIAGTISGNVRASGIVHIEKKGHLLGNAHMKAFIIDEGGIFEGESKMDDFNIEGNKKLEIAAE
ncbi:polymer-forming cytoskeletal protein [Radiobacillus sp. PE A8.2]|uniref:bactofilin family protein n=1 Tax=Radiobacillus sp. PE A8.2 TaxID=3380349 RepID=UPI00388FDC13